jgi:hypothetical protein
MRRRRGCAIILLVRKEGIGDGAGISIATLVLSEIDGFVELSFAVGHVQRKWLVGHHGVVLRLLEVLRSRGRDIESLW